MVNLRDCFDDYCNRNTSAEDFYNNLIPFLSDLVLPSMSSLGENLKNWKVRLYNEDKHELFPHQVKAIFGCINEVVLSEVKNSGYCFMPTSAGKGHILMTLAGMAIGDFAVVKCFFQSDVLKILQHDFFPILISLSLEYSKRVAWKMKTQILVHDIEILKQIKQDCFQLLGDDLSEKIEFNSIQAHRNEERRKELKYVIIDECHWGNATEEETIQSSLISAVRTSGGSAFGFTASPYTEGKFLKTWSENQLNSDMGFNYYLDNKILYEVTLKEVNLQNAKVGYEEGGEEEDLTEKDKKQVIDFMANQMKTTLPTPLDGPAICFYSSIIIPDIVETIKEIRPDLFECTKVLASDSAFFANKCKEMFGEDILATENDISRLKKGEKILLISRQKLLVGLNAPYLRYCFISPTNSKITIMQGIGRLMRPISLETVPRKLATLFLTSLSGKKMSISGKGAELKEEENQNSGTSDFEGNDNPKNRYTTTSMTLSEAYDLPHRVFYKTEVTFGDFINEKLVNDYNSVEFIKNNVIDPKQLDECNAISLRDNINRIRDLARAQYKHAIWKRDRKDDGGISLWCCQGKKILGNEGCERTDREVNLEIHHMAPYTFIELFRKLGKDGVLKWHADPENLKYLITLCEDCHDLIHSREEEADEQKVA